MSDGDKPKAAENSLCQWHDRDITDIKKVLFGNGKEGMRVEVAIIRQRVNLLIWLVGIVAVGVIGYIVKDIMTAIGD